MPAISTPDSNTGRYWSAKRTGSGTSRSDTPYPGQLTGLPFPANIAELKIENCADSPGCEKAGGHPHPTLETHGGGYSRTPHRWWSTEWGATPDRARGRSHPERHPVTPSAKLRHAAELRPHSGSRPPAPGDWHPLGSVCAQAGIPAQAATGRGKRVRAKAKNRPRHARRRIFRRITVGP
jgi:hypothetical protein